MHGQTNWYVGVKYIKRKLTSQAISWWQKILQILHFDMQKLQFSYLAKKVNFLYLFLALLVKNIFGGDNLKYESIYNKLPKKQFFIIIKVILWW